MSILNGITPTVEGKDPAVFTPEELEAAIDTEMESETYATPESVLDNHITTHHRIDEVTESAIDQRRKQIDRLNAEIEVLERQKAASQAFLKIAEPNGYKIPEKLTKQDKETAKETEAE